MSIQVIRQTAQGLVNYVANEMRRPDVAANLQQWNIAMINKHLDILSNDIKSKQKLIANLKNQSIKHQETNIQLQKLKEIYKNQIFDLERNKKEIDQYKNMCEFKTHQISQLQKSNEGQKSCNRNASVDICKLNKQITEQKVEIERLNRLIAQQKANIEKQIKNNQTSFNKSKLVQTERDNLKKEIMELKSKLIDFQHKSSAAQKKLYKLEKKLKNQKLGINPVTLENMFDND